MNGVINKTMDRADLSRPDCRDVLDELFGLMRRMRRRGVSYSSWYGTLGAWPGPWETINRGRDYEPFPGNPDEVRVPWFLLWEIAWVVANTPLRPGSRVLDMGGAGSLFACFLASRGHEVLAIDLNPQLVEQTERIGRAMGWRLRGQVMDMRVLAFPDRHFTHVFSICVLEHLPVAQRADCNARVACVLEPHGTASFTFDYGNPQAFARLDGPQDVERQIVRPSGLTLRGNRDFHDNLLRYLEAPPYFGFGRLTAAAARLNALVRGTVDRRRVADRYKHYTFGAVFLERTDGPDRPETW